jgi:hypothetical protein
VIGLSVIVGGLSLSTWRSNSSFGTLETLIAVRACRGDNPAARAVSVPSGRG